MKFNILRRAKSKKKGKGRSDATNLGTSPSSNSNSNNNSNNNSNSHNSNSNNNNSNNSNSNSNSAPNSKGSSTLSSLLRGLKKRKQEKTAAHRHANPNHTTSPPPGSGSETVNNVVPSNNHINNNTHTTRTSSNKSIASGTVIQTNRAAAKQAKAKQPPIPTQLSKLSHKSNQSQTPTSKRAASKKKMHRGDTSDTHHSVASREKQDANHMNHNHNSIRTDTPHHNNNNNNGIANNDSTTIRHRSSGGGKLSNRSKNQKNMGNKETYAEDASVARMYDLIPPLEVTQLPRGGISIETDAVGRIQFGIPPETIKDSMRMGLDVPLYYIVPIERFCREMGPALGVNLAEFEFPAYFNFFVQKERCTLIVDSEDAERNIRRVFSETLLGPAHFRDKEHPIRYDPEDFAPDFNPKAIPDFEKELRHFRVMPDGMELVLETLLNFCHFEQPFDSRTHDNLGVPPAEPEEDKPVDKEAVGDKKPKPSEYHRMKLCAEVSVVYPKNATQKEIANRTCKRVEIFKTQGGEVYIMHDVDENNIIVGKTRFSGNVRVSESMSVHGFGGDDGNLEDFQEEDETLIPRNIQPPTFHPPSFGVTVLGNSHGFDKSGSVSGYVLWINGRGVMIDPPPYSSATLEREGIRPRTIVGIILTHCHADHDAGAFQKVLTGSPVVVITTPTIYKSFIRKYAALSNLSPALLRHSHRHKPAIIGTPLRFQGATFQFTYTLHSIPCVGFRVEWRGRSMVFTGDHFNSPPDIDKLQDSGVLAADRAEDLRNLPLQDTDLLLHEAGVPPLHTPLDVLLKLPQSVKDHLYVVHTQALPPGCELRVAPTGTKGTIRLDGKEPNPLIGNVSNRGSGASSSILGSCKNLMDKLPYEDEVAFQSMWSSSEYETYGDYYSHTAPQTRAAPRSSINSYSHSKKHVAPPQVALRPTSSTDAWFTLNLLSAVPFLSGLSYASTMEVLETARVDAFCISEVVVHASRRSEVLCVVWEGTCMERPVITNKSVRSLSMDLRASVKCSSKAVWHAGDWTGPISLQPEKNLSGESHLSDTHDVVAMSQQGVKVITIEFASLHKILKSGSSLYRTYLQRKKEKEMIVTNEIPECLQGISNNHIFLDAVRNLEILELLEFNTALKKLSAVQKRHLESLAEGPVYYAPGQRLWRSGTAVEKAFIVVGGTVSFVAKRRNAGSAGGCFTSNNHLGTAENSKNDEYGSIGSSIGSSIGEIMRRDAAKVRLEHDDDLSIDSSDDSSSSSVEVAIEKVENIDICAQISSQDSVRSAGSSVYNHEYEKLSLGLQKRADNVVTGSYTHRRGSESTDADNSHNSNADFSTENEEEADAEAENESRLLRSRERRRSSKDRNVNRQLNRLYNRRAFTTGLVFSKGHFLGDISKMVAGLLSSSYDCMDNESNGDDNSARYGFGEKNEGNPNSRASLIGDMTIHEQEGDQHIVHISTLAAGKDGCVVLVFPKPSLIGFLDEYPGLLLSLLGAQMVI